MFVSLNNKKKYKDKMYKVLLYIKALSICSSQVYKMPNSPKNYVAIFRNETELSSNYTYINRIHKK